VLLDGRRGNQFKMATKHRTSEKLWTSVLLLLIKSEVICKYYTLQRGPEARPFCTYRSLRGASDGGRASDYVAARMRRRRRLKSQTPLELCTAVLFHWTLSEGLSLLRRRHHLLLLLGLAVQAGELRPPRPGGSAYLTLLGGRCVVSAVVHAVHRPRTLFHVRLCLAVCGSGGSSGGGEELLAPLRGDRHLRPVHGVQRVRHMGPGKCR
jgi:hypothetical protein